jgi:hypothetical protein
VAASTDLTPNERRLRAQAAANTRWSRPGAREAHSEKTRQARHDHYERKSTLTAHSSRSCAASSPRTP